MTERLLQESFTACAQAANGMPSQRHVLTDGRGIPIAVTLTGANIHDKWMVGATLDAIPIWRLLKPLLPKSLCLDKGYDYDDPEQEARARGVKPHIRRRGEPPLVGCVRGKPRRWVVELTNIWHNNFRGLRVRWERKAENYSALVKLACAIITFQAAAPSTQYLSSLSTGPLRRHHPRQEPDAVVPHLRICGGGRG
jgi:putative transposase